MLSHSNFSDRTKGLIAINIAAIVFGCAALFGKLDVSPFWIVALRAGFAALALAPFAIHRHEFFAPTPKEGQKILMTSFLLALHWLSFFAAVQMAGVAIATLTFAAFPFFTVLIEMGQQKRKAKPIEIIASLAILGGVALLVNPQNETANFAGICMGLFSAITFAWFGSASKKLGETLSPLRISLFQNAVVAILIVPFLFFAPEAPDETKEWLLLIFLGVVTTALMHQLYFYALRRLSASSCSGFIALEPVYAILFAALLFHEPITIWVIASGAMILLSSFAMYRFGKS
jgi:drug/metabolite transporter (DMT)-like permease